MIHPLRTVIYLHGFASSPHSTKAAYFGRLLRERGVSWACPDFNEPDFATMTMTRMLEQLDREIDRASQPIALMGSSLGGTLAVLAAGRFGPRVDRLVLLAPAVMFAKAGHHLLPPDRVAEWRRQGSLPFFHYGANEERMLNATFYEDSLRYNAFDTEFPQPALIFQGRYDASVDPRTVEEFARARRNVTLTLMEDDHQLIKSLDRMWHDTAAFLGVGQS